MNRGHGDAGAKAAPTAVPTVAAATEAVATEAAATEAAGPVKYAVQGGDTLGAIAAALWRRSDRSPRPTT